MIVLDHTLISDDVKEAFFVCDLNRCKGACCVEGDLGAPLEDQELEVMERIYPEVKSYLSPEGQQAIEQQGVYIKDYEDDFSTPTINGKECAYAIYDTQGILKCGIEQAYQDGKIDFQKPISCHLYPLRVTSYEEYDAINYDRWKICAPACSLGAATQTPLYKFLKEPLIRKYGRDWYQRFEQLVTSPDQKDQSHP